MGRVQWEEADELTTTRIYQGHTGRAIKRWATGMFFECNRTLRVSRGKKQL